MRSRVIPFLLAIFLSGGEPAAAAGGTVEVELCPSRTELVRRTGRTTCWARLTLSEDRQLCIPEALWHEWLKRPVPLCGVWSGKWKSWVPQVNDPRLRGERRAEIKQPRFEFRAQALPRADPRSLESVERIRWAIERERERLSGLLRPSDGMGVLRRLLVDERMPGSSEKLLRVLGFVHLVSATGIHLYAMARLADRLVFSLAAGAGLSWTLARRISGAVSVLLWLSAWILEGARPGMFRPWLIVILRTGGRYLGIRWRMFAPLGLALSVDLGVALYKWIEGAPEAWAPGRVHYVLAVGGGLLAMEWHRGSGKWEAHGIGGVKSALHEHLALSVGSWLFTAIWDAWDVGLVATFTPILSLLTIPLYTLVIYPVLLFGSALAASGFSAEGHWIFAWAGRASDLLILASGEVCLRLATLWVVPLWALIAGTAVALMPARMRVRVLVLVIAFRMIALVSESIESAPRPGPVKALTVEQLDVGQGDSSLIQYSRSAGLIDAGSAHSASPDRWIGILGRRGIQAFDFVALTHLDEDHAGGLRRLSALVPIGCVVTDRAQWETPRGSELRGLLEERGIVVTDWGREARTPEMRRCFPFHVLGARPERAGGKPRANGAMSSFLVELEDGRFYFNAGDADAREELRAARWAARRIRPGSSVIMKVSHHGSRFSTTDELIRILRPRVAWISSGGGNHYGHPAVSVLSTLATGRVPVRRTDREGALGSGDGPFETRSAGARVYRERSAGF